jgi:hypothetical protein
MLGSRFGTMAVDFCRRLFLVVVSFSLSTVQVIGYSLSIGKAHRLIRCASPRVLGIVGTTGKPKRPESWNDQKAGTIGKSRNDKNDGKGGVVGEERKEIHAF